MCRPPAPSAPQSPTYTNDPKEETGPKARVPGARRVVIEQAKGAVAYAHDLPVEEAFTRIRGYARSHGLPISVVAQRIVAFELDV